MEHDRRDGGARADIRSRPGFKSATFKLLRDTLRVESALLILMLVAGAYLMAMATAPTNRSWLGWFTLFPLFVAIRVQRPLRAMLSGAVWGLSLYAFLSAGVATLGGPEAWRLSLYGGLFSTNIASQGGAEAGWLIHGLPVPLLLFTVVPALYGLLGAALTRWIGFSPFVLGVGWVGVELALAPLGLRYGVLGAAQTDAWFFPAVGHLLGYVFVAFLAAYVSALLVTVLTRVAVSCLDDPRVFNAGRRAGSTLLPQTFRCFPLYIIPACQPRAPPLELTVY